MFDDGIEEALRLGGIGVERLAQLVNIHLGLVGMPHKVGTLCVDGRAHQSVEGHETETRMPRETPISIPHRMVEVVFVSDRP